MTLFGRLADPEDGKIMSQNNHLVWVWDTSFFHGSEMEEGEETEVKVYSVLKYLLEWQASGRGCVNVFFPAIYRWTEF